MGFVTPHPPLSFVLEGRYLHWPATPGVEIAERVAAGDWAGVVPGMLDIPSRELVWSRVLDPSDRFTMTRLYRASIQVIEQVCGVPWHVAVRLLGLAEGQWLLFDGWCLSHGLHTDAMPVGKLVTGVHQWLRDGCAGAEDPQKEWDRLEAELWAEPARAASGSDGWVPEEAASETDEALREWGLL